MSETSRRSFIAAAGGALSAGAIASASASPANSTGEWLVHHVFFWLQNPDSLADRDALISGLRTLGKIETVRDIHIGVPADTEQRGVVDSSWSVSEILYFEDVEGQNIYQEHPIHKAFVEKNAHLWAKVVVYDAVPV